jgi:hypothetical protein
VLSSHPGPPGTGLYPLLNTSIDNELAIPPPVTGLDVVQPLVADLGVAPGGR